MKNKIATTIVTMLICSFFFIGSALNVEASKNFTDVPNDSSHYKGIQYLNGLNVYDYKNSNRFFVNDSIPRNEVVKILNTLFGNRLEAIRKYENSFSDVQSTNPFYKEIVWSYEVGIFDGDQGRFKGNESLTRAQLAKILVNSFDIESKGTFELKDVKKGNWAFDYVSKLYGNGITTGSNGYFMPNNQVTNGQFASFIYRTIQITNPSEADNSKEENPVPEENNKKTNIEDIEKPSEDVEEETSTREKASENILATYITEYDFVWNQIGKNKNFELEGVNDEGEIVAHYSTINDKELFGIKIGKSTESDVLKQYGSKLEGVFKNNTHYRNVVDPGHAMYLIKGKYVTFFYDQFKNDQVRSILWVEESYEKNKDGFYGGRDVAARQESYEDLMVELMNQARASEGLHVLKGTQKYKEIARKHSRDMVDNNFFSHTGSNGSNPMDRMLAGDMDFIYSSGENLAKGQYNTIFAHEGLMNSQGHRENILRIEFTHAFTGVEFEDVKPYWTVNFYSER